MDGNITRKLLIRDRLGHEFVVAEMERAVVFDEPIVSAECGFLGMGLGFGVEIAWHYGNGKIPESEFHEYEIVKEMPVLQA